MSMTERREKLIATLSEQRERIRQLETLLQQARNNEMQITGAILLCDELLEAEKASAAALPSPPAKKNGGE